MPAAPSRETHRVPGPGAVVTEVVDILADHTSVDEQVEMAEDLPDDEHRAGGGGLLRPQPPGDVERRRAAIGNQGRD